jgi:flagellar biogenesis protein FliO
MSARRLAFLTSGAAALLAAAPAAAQRLGQGTGTEVPIWRVLGALLFCLLLAVAAAFFLRRRMSGAMPLGLGGRARRLQLVETIRLSHQVDLCLVRCDDRELLLAATPHGAAPVAADLPAPPPARDPSP